MDASNKNMDKSISKLTTFKIFALIAFFWTAVMLIIGFNASIWVKNKGH